MEPVVERKCSGGLSPARGREAPLNAAGRITVAPVAIKIRVLSSSGFARKVRLCIAISVSLCLCGSFLLSIFQPQRTQRKIFRAKPC
jgi:hypothetical protein